MKRQLLAFPGFFLAITCILLLPGCKKSAPAPDYPQLIGAWSGTTSQGQSFRLSVNNVGGALYLTFYRTVVVFNTGGSRTLEQTNPEGIVALSDRAFSIPYGSGIYGPGYIDGLFDLNTLAVSGTFRIYNPSIPNDYITGYFSASLNK